MDIRQLRANLQLKIVEVINENVDKEFIFGERDCHTLTLQIFDAVVGSDALKFIYKKYTTPIGGQRLQTKIGMNMKEFIQRYCDPVDLSLLTSGDFMITYHPEQKFYSIYWYLGNSRFAVASLKDNKVEIEHYDVRYLSCDEWTAYRFKDDALLLKIEPLNITNNESEE